MVGSMGQNHKSGRFSGSDLWVGTLWVGSIGRVQGSQPWVGSGRSVGRVCGSEVGTMGRIHGSGRNNVSVPWVGSGPCVGSVGRIHWVMGRVGTISRFHDRKNGSGLVCGSGPWVEMGRVGFVGLHLNQIKKSVKHCYSYWLKYTEI